MKREDIIRMARNCFDVYIDERGRETFSGDHFCVEELVALVTKAEREACAKLLDDNWYKTQADCAAAIRARRDK